MAAGSATRVEAMPRQLVQLVTQLVAVYFLQGEDAHDDGLIYLIPPGTTKIKKYEDDDEEGLTVRRAT